MRFPEVPLKRFGRIVGGATPRALDELWDGDITWYTPTDVSKAHGATLGESARTLSRAGMESCSVVPIPSGSVVFTSRAPIGNVALADRPCTTSQGCKTLIPDPGTEPRFVLYCAMVRVAEMQAAGTGTTFLEVSGERLGMVRFPKPDHFVQGLVADFLDDQCGRIARLSTGSAAQARVTSVTGALARLGSLLAEYRDALITEAVTGQLDVAKVSGAQLDERLCAITEGVATTGTFAAP